MHKTKKSLIVFLAIIFILIIVAIILISQERRADRLVRLYKKILDNNKYTFSMEEENIEHIYKMTVSQKDNNINIDTQSGEDISSTLILDGHVYVIMHNLKQYYTVDGNSIDGDIILSGLKEMANEKYIKGKEIINGKTYYYEEYKNKSNFVQLLHETDNCIITTRFYFDKNNLVYIRNIIEDEGKKEEELLKVVIKYEVNDDVFKIPEDYAEM